MTNAINVNGSPDKVSWGNILTVNTVVSACFWIYPTANSSSNQETIFGYGNTRWFFIYGDTTTKLRFSAIAGGSEKNTGGNTVNALPLNQWSFVTGTYDPNGGTNNITIRVYNSSGVFIEQKAATITGSIGATGQPLEFGHDPNRGFFIKAETQLIKVYSRILTTTEQDNLALFINPDNTGLIGQWDFNEGSGTTVADVSGSGNTGTITGSTWVSNGPGPATTTSTSSSTSTTSTSSSTTTSTSSSTSSSTSTTTTISFEYHFAVKT